MIASERARYILNRLKEKEVVTLKEIADELGVSIATVRRDFEKLDEKGLAVKVRSGATRASLPGPSVAPMVTSEKSKEHIEAKISIASKAASLVKDGDCIFLDGGTTIAPMIDFIQDKKNPYRHTQSSDSAARSEYGRGHLFNRRPLQPFPCQHSRRLCGKNGLSVSL